MTAFRRCGQHDEERNVPERTVESTSEFGAICHQRRLTAQAGIQEALFDSFATTVHHIARRDAVCARFRVVDRDLCDPDDGRGVVDRPVRVQDTAVAVRGVFAETDVYCDVDRWEKSPNGLDRMDHRSVRIISQRTLVILDLWGAQRGSQTSVCR